MPLPIVITISFHLLSIIGLHTCTLRARSLSPSHSRSLSLSLCPQQRSLCMLERALVVFFALAVVAAINKFALAALKMLRGAAALSCQFFVVVVVVANNRGSNNCENKQQQQNAKTHSVVMQSEKY